jgi:hypothetical protein
MICLFKKPWLPIILSLLLSCNKDNCVVSEKYLNGSIKIRECQIDGKAEHFCYENYYKNNVLKSTYCLKNGKYEGEVINYYPSGIKRSHLIYSNGLRNGSCYRYNEDGKIITLNYCLNDTTIYGKFYKYDSSGEVKVEETFNPIVRLVEDTLSIDADSFKFTINLPIPDSLIEQEYSIFKYGLKPLSLKDSITIDADIEVRVFYDALKEGGGRLTTRASQVFYGYIYDEEKRAVYSPVERIITITD